MGSERTERMAEVVMMFDSTGIAHNRRPKRDARARWRQTRVRGRWRGKMK